MRYFENENVAYSTITDISNRHAVHLTSPTSIKGSEFRLFQFKRFRINHGRPSDKRISNELEPKEFEQPT